jgi:hypothetical protein
MTSQFGFTKMTIQEFENWVSNLRVARTVIYIQQHHTYIPDYKLFKGNNHFDLQRAMKQHHINGNGWSDIGQHFSSFPDGTILTGRSLENSPACIYGNNANAICIEHVGNFDTGKDAMTTAHRNTIIRMTAALCKRFGVPVNANKIVYHHWYNLSTGVRNDGSGGNKSCPGTGFFGGNKVQQCERNFLPLIRNAINGTLVTITSDDLLKYVCVNTSKLNIRKKASADSEKTTDRSPATYGAILRVYKEQNGWYKISSSKQHWISGKFTVDVKRAVVTTDTLNVRSGPATSYSKTGAFTKGQELFIVEEKNNWCKIAMDEKWVHADYVKIS